ncbi:hypothetical protein [Veronia nyctiphanis]|nr:hypothetical protein [Veronia nyctiphanis]
MVNRLPLSDGEHVLVTGATSNTALFAIKKLLLKPVTVHALTTSLTLSGSCRPWALTTFA